MDLLTLEKKTTGFYNFLEINRLRNKDLVNITGYDKGNVSKYINKKLNPPDNFLTTIEKHFSIKLEDYLYKVTSKKEIKQNKEVDTVDIIDLNFKENEKEYFENSFGNKFERLPNGEYLMYMPLFEWDVAASLLDNEGDTRHPDYAEIEQHVTVVKNPLQGKYSAFRIKGGSMEGTEVRKFIPDGSIVWGRELQRIHWRDKLRFNKYPLWVIASTDFGRPTLKEIVNHDVDKAIITVDSWNPSVEYAHNVEVSLNTVKMLFYIMKVESSFSVVY